MSTAEAKEISRRGFLARGIAACLAFLATMIGIPLVGAAVAPALRRTEPSWVTLGRVDAFQPGVPVPVEFAITRQDGWILSEAIKAVWVVRQEGEDFDVFVGRCTHLGCAYRWDPAQNMFICPCHAGFFAKDGQVVSGPPPRPLDELPYRIEGGVLETQYTDFRLGSPEQVPA